MTPTNAKTAALEALIEAHAIELVAANLKEALLAGAHIEGAHLYAAHLEGAVMAGAHLEKAVLGEAVYDDDTLWPQGLDYEPMALGTSTRQPPSRIPSHPPTSFPGGR